MMGSAVASRKTGMFEVMSGMLNERALRDLVGEGKNGLDVSGGGGHLTVRWDGNDADDVKNAERTFKDLVDKGYKAFKMIERPETEKPVVPEGMNPKAVDAGDGKTSEPDCSKGESVTHFEKDAKAYVMIPPVRGG